MNGTLEIPCAGALHHLARLRGNMLLYGTALSEAIARGYSAFSFGRSSADSGTFTFKKNWGATASPLPYHYLLAPGEAVPTMRPDNPRYAKVIAAWQHLPVPVATALGPRIVRYLP
jgi:serine/alanine adding enzyme